MNTHVKEQIVRLVASLPDGTYIVENSDGRLERKTDQTDWSRVDAMTDEEIEAAMRNDPDWADLIDMDWSKAELVYLVKKQPVSIRLDEDIITYFKKTGRDYQTRINAVLRSYMDHNIHGKG